MTILISYQLLLCRRRTWGLWRPSATWLQYSGVLPSDFTYAGFKDKRVITYQAIVVKKISPERISVHPRTTNCSLSSGNAKESLALMPANKARERLMLRALHRYSSGQECCTRGWLSLPHSMRVFYFHSYCSRVWNQLYRPITYCSGRSGFGRVTPLKLNVPGCYRPLLTKPQNITYSLQTSPSDKSNTHCLSLNFDLEASCYTTVSRRDYED
ncbi:pseudouridylate synthase PUS7L [Danio rerio]|uniref:Pseudouridylate synthase PUS7L n=1 Tax=Danio rerio TaxID=7955 RepID=A0AC58J8T1_DANRE